MFYIKEPSSLGAPWILSNCNEKIIAVSKDTTRDLKNHDVLGIDFLYQCYKKQFKGAIFNEEDGLNMQLQVAAFLNAIFNQAEQKFLVLILTPDDNVVKWHYHLIRHGELKVQIIQPNTCPEEFDQEHGLALILSFSHIKLAEYLIDYDYFSVVIDNFDEVASKLIIRKLCGTFNIGLTQRNFYTFPNQKLQWTMLNWSNPGCVGKLVDFYEIDNDNFANFRDNYRHWWFRLTWNYCESFKRPTEKEKDEYLKTLSKWAVANQIQYSHYTTIKTRKRKNTKEENNDSKKLKPETVKIKQENNENDTPKPVSVKQDNDVTEKWDAGSSDGTIIYEYDTDADGQKQDSDPNYVQLPSMDENPILNSIIRNLETSPEPIASHHHSYNFTDGYDQPTCSKALDDDDVLMSIIDDTPPNVSPEPLDHETQVSYKKEELLTQIFCDEPCTSKNVQTEEDSEFFRSLVDTEKDVSLKKRHGIRKGKCDIEDILKETEILLRE